MQKERIFTLIGFITLTLIAYRDCFGIFIPGDNFSLFYVFEKEGLWSGIKNIGPYLFSLPAVFLFYKFIGASSFFWITISLAIHATNAFLAYLFAEKSIGSIIKKPMHGVAIFAGLLFLISPYQTEALLWMPTDLVISVATLLFLVSLLLFINYLASSKRSTLYLLHLAFLLAVFSYETVFILPGISLMVFILYKSHNSRGITLKQFIIRVLFPQVNIILMYFITTKILFGHWISHGENFELPFSVVLFAQNLLKYLAKFFLLYRYLPLGSIDGTIRDFVIHHGYIVLILSMMIILFLFSSAILVIKRKNANRQFLILLFACFIISILPVLPFDSSFLSYIYPDRYGYLPSVFFYIFLASSAFVLLKKIALPVMIAYAVLCMFLLEKTTSVWNSASEYCNEATNNYKAILKYDRVYVLNVPAYYKGVAAFRSAFAETIYWKHDRFPAEKIRAISGYYHEADSDSLLSVSVKGDTVFVSGPKKRTPFFSTDGGWAKSYQTDEYKVDFDPSGCSYTLTFKQGIPKNSVFVRLSGTTWKKAVE